MNQGSAGRDAVMPRQFAPDELAAVFRAARDAGLSCTLLGGQASNFWARKLAEDDPMLLHLGRCFSLTSKDVDFCGSREEARRMAENLGAALLPVSLREAFGSLLAGKFIVQVNGHPLRVEFLRRIPGLTVAETASLASTEDIGGAPVRVLNPLAALFAKAWNVAHIPQAERHDAEQLLALVCAARVFLRQLLEQAGQDHARLRAALKLIERLLRFAELPAGRKAAAACGVNWAWVLPHARLAADTRPAVVRLRTRRLPGWLAGVARQRRGVPAQLAALKMLTLLTEHAEPPCVPAPAIARAARYASRRA